MLIDSWTDENNVNAVTRNFSVPAGKSVSVGQTILLAVSMDSASLALTVSDSKSNAWVTVDNAGSTNVTGQLLACKVTTALVAGDTITIAQSSSRFRCAIVAAIFDDISSTAKDSGSIAKLLTQSSVTNTVTMPAAPAFGGLAILMVGATGPAIALQAVTNGFTVIGSKKTTAGTSDRVACIAYKYIKAQVKWFTKVTFAATSEYDVLLCVLPATILNPTGDVITIIGDSLTYQGGAGDANLRASALGAGFNNDQDHLYVDGLTSREIDAAGASPYSTAALDTASASNFIRNKAIIELGTNSGGYSVSDTKSKIHSLCAKIGSGIVFRWIGVGYQTQADCDYTYDSNQPVGSRYIEVGTRSRVNVVLLNMLENQEFNIVNEAVPRFYDWNRSSAAANARAGGATNWDNTDTTAPSGNARHLTAAGYSNFYAPYYFTTDVPVDMSSGSGGGAVYVGQTIADKAVNDLKTLGYTTGSVADREHLWLTNTKGATGKTLADKAKSVMVAPLRPIRNYT